MIIWNKGEPPKDGGWYLVTAFAIRQNIRGWRWVGQARWNEWKNEWSFTGIQSALAVENTNIMAWSEINLPEES